MNVLVCLSLVIPAGIFQRLLSRFRQRSISLPKPECPNPGGILLGIRDGTSDGILGISSQIPSGILSKISSKINLEIWEFRTGISLVSFSENYIFLSFKFSR